MSNVKYVGMDVHKAITVIVVLNALGQIESRSQVKTKAENICDFFRGLSGRVEVIFEEGAHSAWLSQLLKPLAASVIVCDPRRNKLIGAGNKSDDEDAEKLARLLRMGEIKVVYKGGLEQQQLKEVCRTYQNLVDDLTRAKNRLKAIYRARGIEQTGTAIYRPRQRMQWLAKLSDDAARFRAGSLFEQIDMISRLGKQAKQQLVKQACGHPDYRLLLRLPGFGPVRVAQLIAVIGTPSRFRTKRQFWPYCGLAVVTRSSADYRIIESKIIKQQKKVSTRGLNRNHNPQLKEVFKGAALAALRHEPVKDYYQRLVNRGTKPELARISLARKLAAITLAVWQRREEFDIHRAFTQNLTVN
jgi:transposase